MRIVSVFLTALAALAGVTFALAAETAKIEITVDGIPAGAAQVVVIFDAGAPPPQSYEDAAAAAVPAPAAAAVQQVLQQVQPPGAPAAIPANPAAPPAAEDPAGQPRRRRGRGGAAGPALPPPTRAVAAVNGRSSATLTANVPVADNYQARVVALNADDTFPTVLAGGRLGSLKLVANQALPLQVALKAPALNLAPGTPKAVARGARYQLAGTLTDGARALGSKNRMRVWISEGTSPAANYAGMQSSTVDVTTNGDDVLFTFDLIAPAHATTLYYQFGELPADFARADGTQAAFVVLPDLATGAKPLELRVE